MTLSRRDVIYSAQLAVASLVTYWIAFYGLFSLIDLRLDQLGAMWAAARSGHLARPMIRHKSWGQRRQ